MELKKLNFISGKGGTGKSTLALLLAKQAADQGRRVLLVELSQRSSAVALAGLKQEPQYQPQKTQLGFHHSLVSGLDCLVEYVSSFTKVESITKKFFENHLIQSLVNVAPGLNDLAILGKLTSGIRQHGPAFEFDHIIIDAPTTGSFSSLIQAPQLLAGSVSGGPLKTQSESIHRVLLDPSHVNYFFVALYEELPVDELKETLDSWLKDYKTMTHVVLNKEWPEFEPQHHDPAWESFVKNRLSEMKRQQERVSQMVESHWSLPLIYQEFHQFIKQQPGEILRPH